MTTTTHTQTTPNAAGLTPAPADAATAAVAMTVRELHDLVGAVLPHAYRHEDLPALHAVRFEAGPGAVVAVATDRYAIGAARYLADPASDDTGAAGGGTGNGAGVAVPPGGPVAVNVDLPDVRRLLTVFPKGRQVKNPPRVTVLLTVPPAPGTAGTLRVFDGRTALTVTGTAHQFPDWRRLLGRIIRAPAAIDTAGVAVHGRLLAKFHTAAGSGLPLRIYPHGPHGAVIVTCGTHFLGGHAGPAVRAPRPGRRRAADRLAVADRMPRPHRAGSPVGWFGGGGVIVDLFAGPGGWDVAARALGLTPLVGLEIDPAACATRAAAGHTTIRADVAAYPTGPFAGKVAGLVASPPCQAWSMAGKRKGEADRAACHALADRMAAGDDTTGWTSWEDARSPLACQPVRWVRDLRPLWVALEEVPPVASLFTHFARIFRGWGYRVWTGDANAADYGVPQTRVRRFLLANRTGPLCPPEPTHARHGCAGDLFESTRAPWVSMAAAIGWGLYTPAPTVIAGSGRWGAHDPLDGGSRARRAIREARARGEWVLQRDGQCKDPHPPITQPAPTMTSASLGRGLLQLYAPDGTRQRVTLPEAGVLQSFPSGYPWRGTKRERGIQIGNAVPPRLAVPMLAAAAGLPAADAESGRWAA